MVVWSIGGLMVAIAAWYDGTDGLLATVQPLVSALTSVVWACYFWLMATNWRGWAKRQWEKPGWGNRHPTEYVRPQSRFIQAAARFGVPFILLSDLLVIGLVFGR